MTTVAGAKVELERPQVSKFDFAAGSIKYLSDLDPVGLEESGTDPEHYQRDKNLDKRPIQLVVDPAAGRVGDVPQGADAQGQDDHQLRAEGAVQGRSGRSSGWTPTRRTRPASQVKVTIDDAGAGVNLLKGAIKKGDKPLDLNLNVTNVDRLKITVESDGTVTDLGNQVSFGNARVLK